MSLLDQRSAAKHCCRALRAAATKRLRDRSCDSSAQGPHLVACGKMRALAGTGRLCSMGVCCWHIAFAARWLARVPRARIRRAPRWRAYPRPGSGARGFGVVVVSRTGRCTTLMHCVTFLRGSAIAHVCLGTRGPHGRWPDAGADAAQACGAVSTLGKQGQPALASTWSNRSASASAWRPAGRCRTPGRLMPGF